MAGDLRRIQRRHWGLVVVATLLALITGTPGPGGVALGGAVMGLSVVTYVVLFDVAIRGQRRVLAIGLLFAKLAAFLGLVWLAFTSGSGRPDPVGFALGVMCFPTAAIWEAVRSRKG